MAPKLEIDSEKQRHGRGLKGDESPQLLVPRARDQRVHSRDADEDQQRGVRYPAHAEALDDAWNSGTRPRPWSPRTARTWPASAPRGGTPRAKICCTMPTYAMMLPNITDDRQRVEQRGAVAEHQPHRTRDMRRGQASGGIPDAAFPAGAPPPTRTRRAANTPQAMKM